MTEPAPWYRTVQWVNIRPPVRALITFPDVPGPGASYAQRAEHAALLACAMHLGQNALRLSSAWALNYLELVWGYCERWNVQEEQRYYDATAQSEEANAANAD